MWATYFFEIHFPKVLPFPWGMKEKREEVGFWNEGSKSFSKHILRFWNTLPSLLKLNFYSYKPFFSKSQTFWEYCCMGFLNESKNTEIENYIERYDDYGPDWADFPHFKEQKSEKRTLPITDSFLQGECLTQPRGKIWKLWYFSRMMKKK